SGRRSTLGKRVLCKQPRVRIPPSPPNESRPRESGALIHLTVEWDSNQRGSASRRFRFQSAEARRTAQRWAERSAGPSVTAKGIQASRKRGLDSLRGSARVELHSIALTTGFSGKPLHTEPFVESGRAGVVRV